jgi:Ca2+-binding RTX toxin-like protein
VKSDGSPVGPRSDVLFIGGTSGNDSVIVAFDHETGQTLVSLNSGYEIFGTSVLLEDVLVSTHGGDDVIVFLCTRPGQTILVDAGEDDDAVLLVYAAPEGRYSLMGGAGADVLYIEEGYLARVTMEGGDGDDQLVLGGGDSIEGTLDGGDGDDWLLVLATGSTTFTLLGGAGKDVLLGGVGADRLEGGEGDDIVLGGLYLERDGDDTLFGGDGTDVLIGGAGADWLYGGAGEDLIVAGALGEDFFGDEETPGVLQVWLQWIEDTVPFLDRIDILLGELEGMIDPQFVFSPGENILDDGAVDVIYGGGDDDWILSKSDEDEGIDAESGDFLTEIDT